MRSPSRTTVVEQRPRHIVLRVDELLRDVRRGRIRLPDFPLALKWEPDDVAQLFDSMDRGFPVGSLLFWEKPATTATVRFGPVSVEAAANVHAWLIVDGQQRVAALVGSLLHPEWQAGQPMDKHLLFYDVAVQRFVQPDERWNQVPPTWIPAQRFLDSEQLLAWWEGARGQLPASTDIQHAVDAAARLRTYPLQVSVVTADDDRPLREMFKRLNAAPRRLESTEIFDALHGRASSVREPRTVATLRADLEQLGFGAIPEAWLLHACLAAQGADITGNLARALDVPRLARDVVKIQAACTMAIAFLQQHAGIPHVAFLPYELGFVALVKFFYFHPAPHPTTFQRLRRWLWRALLGDALSGKSKVHTRDILAAMHQDEHRALSSLVDPVSTSVEVLKLQVLNRMQLKVSLKAANSRLQLAAWMNERPRAWDTHLPLPLAEMVARIESGVLPNLSPNSQPAAPAAFTDVLFHKLHWTLCNALLAPPVVGSKTGVAVLEDAPDDVLASHMLSREIVNAMVDGATTDALVKRSLLVTAMMFSFFSRMAEWEHRDRPPLDTLLLEDG